MSALVGKQCKVGKNLKRNFFLFFSSASLIQSLSPQAERAGFTAPHYHVSREAAKYSVHGLYITRM